MAAGLASNSKNRMEKFCRREQDLAKYPYGFLTKREVKITGYWTGYYCVFMDRHEVEVQKKNEANIQPS